MNQANNTAIRRRLPIRANDALTMQGRIFKEDYAQLISNNRSRAIRKELVFKYHQMISKMDASIRPMTRQEMRLIPVYFSSHAPQRDLILHTLQTLINSGTINYEQDLNALRNRH